MEQNQVQKQEKFVKTCFIIGIVAAVFTVIGLIAQFELPYIVAIFLGLAGVIVGIIAIIRKYEPQKKVYIGTGICALAMIISLFGPIDDSTNSVGSTSYDDYSYYGDLSEGTTYTNTILDKALYYAERINAANKTGDKAAIEKINKEIDSYILTLSDSDKVSFVSYLNDFLNAKAENTSSTSTSTAASNDEAEYSEESSKTNKTHISSSNDYDDDYSNNTYESGYKPSNSEIERLAEEYAKKELSVYDYDDYQDRAAKLDEELESKISNWTASAKVEVFELQEKKFDALVDKRDKKENDEFTIE